MIRLARPPLPSTPPPGRAPPAPRPMPRRFVPQVTARGAPGATGPDAVRLASSGADVASLHAVGTLDGVAVLFASGRNIPGTGYLRSYGDGTSLAWKEPGGSAYGSQLDCSAGGVFRLLGGDDPNAYVRVHVVPSYLSPGTNEARVLLQEFYNNALATDDVTAAEALAGDVETWTIEIRNTHPTWLAVARLKVWLGPFIDNIEISTDGIAWVTPRSEVDPDVLEYSAVAGGKAATVHFRRTIGAAAPSDPDVLNCVEWSFYGN